MYIYSMDAPQPHSHESGPFTALGSRFRVLGAGVRGLDSV